MQQAAALSRLSAVLAQQAQQRLARRAGQVNARGQRSTHAAGRPQVRQQAVRVVLGAARRAGPSCRCLPGAAGSAAGTSTHVAAWRCCGCLLCRLHIEHSLSIQPKPLQQGGHQGGIVLRQHANGVARGKSHAAAGHIQLEVQHLRMAESEQGNPSLKPEKKDTERAAPNIHTQLHHAAAALGQKTLQGCTQQPGTPPLMQAISQVQLEMAPAAARMLANQAAAT